MKEKWLDKKLHERLSGKREFVNTEAGWEDLLDRMDSTERKTRIFPWSWAIVIALFLCSAAGIYMITNHESMDKQIIANQDSAELVTQETRNNSAQINTEKDSKENSIFIKETNGTTTLNKEEQRANSKPKISTGNSLKNEILNDVPGATKPDFKTRSLSKDNTLNITRSSSKVQNKDYLSNSNVHSKPTTTEKTERNQLNATKENSSKLEILKPVSSPLETNLDPQISSDFAPIKSYKYLARNDQRNFELGINLSYGVFSNNLNTADAAGSDIISRRKMAESTLDYAGVSLSAKKYLTKSFFVSATLGYDQYQSKFTDLYTSAYQENQTIDVTEEYKNGNIVNTTEQVVVNYIDVVELNKYNKFTDLRLGLGAGVSLNITEKLGLDLHNFVSYIFHSDAKVNSFAGPFTVGEYIVLDEENYAKDRGVFSNRTAIGMSYLIGSSIEFDFGGQVLFDLNNRLRAETMLMDKFYGFGMYLGISKRF